MKSPKDLLSNVRLYIGLQKALGADRLRYRCLDEAAVQPGESVLDVGCGPAYYFGRFPKPITYHGFDTDAGYLDWARSRWGDDATFHHGILDDASAADLPRFDVVLLLGLLHHVPDDAAASLLQLIASVLRPMGRVVTVDTCIEDGQGRISRWMSENDRGEHVRTPEQFEALARGAFGDVDGTVVRDLTRLPRSDYMMCLRSPVG